MCSDIGIMGIDIQTLSLAKYILICVCTFFLAYCLGNISPATIVAKARGVDIRKEGSGNPGTTNTLRVLGKKAAVIVLVVDIMKGVIAVLLAGWLGGIEMAMIACLAVFLGHVFPVTQHLRGGKGVATAFGALTALRPLLGIGCLAVVLLAVLVTRRVSFGSLFGALACPIFAIFLLPEFLPCAILMAIIVIIRHKDNIVRLKNGEEPPIF